MSHECPPEQCALRQREERVLRVLALEAEREDLQDAEDRAHFDLTAAALVTFVGPIHFLLFGFLQWSDSIPGGALLAGVVLVVFEIALWWLWSRSCDRIAELQTHPNVLLPNPLDTETSPSRRIRDLIHG
ncbi:MAG: hypothetical protein RQ745_05665 [Longimicrobiales bacterium]|nr:hypothetical protein [Longimicrobiales bacterium]